MAIYRIPYTFSLPFERVLNPSEFDRVPLTNFSSILERREDGHIPADFDTHGSLRLRRS